MAEDPLSCESVSYVSPVPGMVIRPNRGKQALAMWEQTLGWFERYIEIRPEEYDNRS